MSTLYIVATPIGNLKDFSQRGVNALAKSEIILAEDTRKTRNLLKEYDISGPKLISFHEHNENEQIPKIISWLNQGKLVSLVSNAGTPLVSDPGYELVRQAVRQKFEIIPIPGPSALLAALVVSGFPPTRFVFLGFLPKSKNKISKIFADLAKNKDLLPTVIFYESPNRLLATLKIISKTLGNVPVVVCRELTKKFEEKIRGSIDDIIMELSERQSIKGEVTVVVKL